MSARNAGAPPARSASPGPAHGTSAPQPVLREMRWWDIEAVLRLEQALFPDDAWSAGMFWSELAHARGPRATRRFLVADAPDAAGDTPAGAAGCGLAGYGGLAAVDGTGDIQTLGVLPAYEGTGLAGRLLTALLTAAETEFACRSVMLEVRVDNERAQRLYRRFGFETIGVRRGYYQPGNIDAYVMRRSGPEAPGDARDDERQGSAHG